MSQSLSQTGSEVAPLTASELLQFNGSPREFWPAFVASMVHLSECQAGALLTRDGENDWSQRARWSVAPGQAPQWSTAIQALAERAREHADGWAHDSDLLSVAFRIDTGGDVDCVLVVYLGTANAQDVARVAERLRLLIAVPAIYAERQQKLRSTTDSTAYLSTLELLSLINKEERFMAAAMLVCNELAALMECDRVSLGWYDGRYVRVRAISRAEKFERKMEAVQQLERAMEECLDQDEEISLPNGVDGAVSREHEVYCRQDGVPAVCSLPIRLQGELIGVMTCGRRTAFSEADIFQLRVACDQLAPRLQALEHRDQWFGARLWRSGLERAKCLVGVEHTGPKLLGAAAAVLLAILAFGTMPYRVEAPFQLHSQEAAYVSSPFDGYIREVLVTVDDNVVAGQRVLQLDTGELVLEHAAASAAAARHAAELDHARANGELAAMRVATAKLEQAKADVALLDYRLAAAEIVAPITGVVVEGELRERIGSPVRKGDSLFRVAQLGDFYVRLQVDQADIHEIGLASTGEIAFASQPNEHFSIKVTRIEPHAIATEGGNVFRVRAGSDAVAGWWRPGMSGVAKIDCGDRAILWVISHRTIDFLRMVFWL